MVTKRQLGIIVIVVTLLGVAGIIGVDVVGAGEWSGFGPLQQMGVGIGVVGVIVGVVLILLGNRPA
ncbi:MAG: hypothetical protein JXA14_16575 [Anaerolineae bacterium]|jgi:hypothetical protein|nr:hypothetical protein [Anaerolineae bacterium]